MVARSHGGPEVIAREDFDPGLPGDGELMIAQEAIGLNFIDTYYRTGLYPAPLPTPLGSEGAGHVVAVGPGVSGFVVGDKVGCAHGLGAYATHRIIAADRAVKIPNDVSSADAAAMMLKGMTACYLAEDTIALEAGQVALVHAAAGGVGSVLVPWLRDRGVVVIAHCGSAAKAALVDADHSLHGPFADLAATVRDLTDGKGVDVVYDGVGKDSWADGELWQCIGRGAASQPAGPDQGRFTLCHTSDAVRLCRDGGGAGPHRRPPVRPDAAWRGARGDRAALCLGGCRAGAPGTGGTADDRGDDPATLIGEAADIKRGGRNRNGFAPLFDFGSAI